MKAAAALAIGALIGIALLALAMHFGDTRNWDGLGATGGAFLTIVAGAEIWKRVERKRATGTYSHRLDRVERARRERQQEF